MNMNKELINYQTNKTFTNDNVTLSNSSSLAANHVAVLAIGCSMFLCATLDVFFNGVLIAVFVKNKSLRRSTTNNLVVYFALLNLVVGLLVFPTIVVACFNGRWPWGKIGCDLNGFFMTFLGISSIHLLTFISIDRYMVTIRGKSDYKLASMHGLPALVLSMLGAAVWGIMPLFGLNFYSFDTYNTSCGPTWKSKSAAGLSYSVAMFVGAFLVPLTVIVSCYTSILIKVFKHSRRKRSFSSSRSRPNSKMNVKIALSIFFVICSFLLSWTPYALISFYTCFNDVTTLHPLVRELPQLIAKYSCTWHPLVYVMNHSHLKAKIRAMLGPCSKSRQGQTSNQNHEITTC